MRALIIILFVLASPFAYAQDALDPVQFFDAYEKEGWTCDIVDMKTRNELTRREKQVAVYMANGYTNEAIAAALGFTTATAKSHVHWVMKKLGIHKRTHVLIRGNGDICGIPGGLISG